MDKNSDAKPFRLFTSLLIDPVVWDQQRVKLFDFLSGMNMPACNRGASSAHTNIPRMGSGGLPKDFKFETKTLRARLGTEESIEVIDFMSTTTVQFQYNNKIAVETTLLDLVHTPHEVEVIMRENMSYGLIVAPQDVQATKRFCEFLARGRFRAEEIDKISARLSYLVGLTDGNPYAHSGKLFYEKSLEVALKECRQATEELWKAIEPKWFVAWFFLEGRGYLPVV